MLLDAGVLVAIDRGEASARALLTALLRAGRTPHTTHPVLAQVWRDGARQSRLARFVQAAVVHPFEDGAAVGAILARSGTSDVVDAHLVAVGIATGHPILTGDVRDISRIIDAVAPGTSVFDWP